MWFSASGSYSVPSAEILGVLSQILWSKDSVNIENVGAIEPFQRGSGSCLQPGPAAAARLPRNPITKQENSQNFSKSGQKFRFLPFSQTLVTTALKLMSHCPFNRGCFCLFAFPHDVLMIDS